jgi:cytoskeletal protein CcmA (bactofilin family)
MRKPIQYLALALLLIAVLATPVAAQGAGNDGQVIFGGTYTLRSGEVLNGNLVVFGGEATVERGAEVMGDVAAFGGHLEIAGRVSGDLAVFGGTVRLRDGAEVFGDLAGFGKVIQEPGAIVHGTKVEGFRFNFTAPEISPGQGLLPFDFLAGRGLGPAWTLVALLLRILRTVVVAASLAAIAGLAVVFLPEQTRQVGQAAQESYAPSFGLGCLVLFLSPIVIVVLILTVLGVIALPFLMVALGIALLFGWIGVGLIVGERTLEALQLKEVPPIVSAVLGVLFISLLAAVPTCIGPLFALIVGSLGLGAVLLTRFGTQPPPQGVRGEGRGLRVEG